MGAVARGAASSTRKTPAPTGGRGRPHTIGPSARTPTARSSAGAERSGVMRSMVPADDSGYGAHVMARLRLAVAFGFAILLLVPVTTVRAADPVVPPVLPASIHRCFVPGPSSSTLTPERVSALQRRVERWQTRRHLPALSVAIIFRDGTTWTGSSGYADLATGTPVGDDTAFAIASVSKTFTSALILALRDEGRIDLEAPVITVPARAGAQPSHHGPPAARPHERPRRLLHRAEDRQGADGRPGEGVVVGHGPRVRREALLRPGPGMALLEHELPAAGADRRARQRRAAGGPAADALLRPARPRGHVRADRGDAAHPDGPRLPRPHRQRQAPEGPLRRLGDRAVHLGHHRGGRRRLHRLDAARPGALGAGAVHRRRDRAGLGRRR